MTIVSLSEAGFACRGFDLQGIEPVFTLRVVLDSRDPDWSPTGLAAATWTPRRKHGPNGVPLRARARLLYLDLDEAAEPGRVTVGAGFEGLGDEALGALREFISGEVFRAREWRTEGGAIPSPGPGRRREA